MPKVTECPTLSTRSYCVFTPLGFVTKYFLIFIIDEVKNFAANNIFKLLELVTYWELCTIGQSCTGIRAKRRCSYIEKFRGSEAAEGFCCKFLYGDCRVWGQRFCTKSETSLYYSELFFRKGPPKFLTVKLVFSLVFLSHHILFYLLFRCMILMFVCFNKFYSQ